MGCMETASSKQAQSRTEAAQLETVLARSIDGSAQSIHRRSSSSSVHLTSPQRAAAERRHNSHRFLPQLLILVAGLTTVTVHA